MSYRNRPVFSSSARLLALARFVSDNDIITRQAQQSIPIRPQTKIINRGNNIVPPVYEPVNTVRNMNDDKYNLNKSDETLYRDYNGEYNANYNTPVNIVNDGQGRTFSVTSAGFNYGNFSEFKFGDKIFLPRDTSRRGMTLLCLTPDYTAFHAWNFDFYPNISKNAMNRNFINILLQLPGNIYFGLAIKDDSYKNLSAKTKNFLARVVGLKTIYRMEYRDSWCAIIYKRTQQTFEVIDESHNSVGQASVNFYIKNNFNHEPEIKSNIPVHRVNKNLEKTRIMPNIRSLSRDVTPNIFKPNIPLHNPHALISKTKNELNDHQGYSQDNLYSDYVFPNQQAGTLNYGNMNVEPPSPMSQESIHNIDITDNGEDIEQDYDELYNDSNLSPKHNLSSENITSTSTEILEVIEKYNTIHSTKLSEYSDYMDKYNKSHETNIKEVQREIERIKVHIKEQLDIVKKIYSILTKNNIDEKI